MAYKEGTEWALLDWSWTNCFLWYVGKCFVLYSWIQIFSNHPKYLVNVIWITVFIFTDPCNSKYCKLCTATFVDLENNKYLYINATKFNDLTYVFGHAHEGVLRMIAYIYDNDKVLIETKGRFIKTAHHEDVLVTAEKWDKGEEGIGNVMGSWQDITMDCI